MTNTFTITTKTFTSITPCKGYSVLQYKGTVMMANGVESKEVFLNAINEDNCGGNVEFRKVEDGEYTFTADVIVK